MKFSFMTWVTPKWTLKEIVDFASKAGYDGVELRVDVGHAHGVDRRISREERDRIRRLFQDNGISVSCIATSVSFGSPDEGVRRENIEVAKRYVELAGDLDAKVIRCFGGLLGSGKVVELNDYTLSYIASAYGEVGDYGLDYGVCPLLEMHDAFSVERYPSPLEASRMALEVLKRSGTRNMGILWNQNALDKGSFNLLGGYIKHFHINKMEEDPEDSMLFETMKLMNSIGFQGFFSLEHIWRESLRNLPPDRILEEHIYVVRGFLSRLVR